MDSNQSPNVSGQQNQNQNYEGGFGSGDGWGAGQNQQDDSKLDSQPLGGEMGGPPMMLSGASSNELSSGVDNSGNQSRMGGGSGNPFGHQQPPQNAMPPQANPFGHGSGKYNKAQQQPPLNQATLIKNVMKLIPKFGPADKDRNQYREQIADSLIREGTNMSKDRLLELDKQVKQFVDQQQVKFSNDGCSSGGSQGGQLSPHTIATSIDSSNNKVALVIQLSLWVEEIIFEKYSDSSAANYRTLVRRLSQALRQKEEQKSTLMTCSDRDSVNNFVQEFMNQRSGGGGSSGMTSSPFGKSAASGSQYAQGAPGTGNGLGSSSGQNSNSANAGGAADQTYGQESSQNNNQEQSAQQNPFGGSVKSPFGGPATRGGPPGGARGRAQGRGGAGRGAAGRGRAMPMRFVAPLTSYSVPASSGSQNTNAPPMPNDDDQQQQTNQQSIQNEQNESHDRSLNPTDDTAAQSNQSPQQQMIESGTDYDSSVLMTSSITPSVVGGSVAVPSQESNQIKGNDQNSDERDSHMLSQNFSSQLKDSGSLERETKEDKSQSSANKQNKSNWMPIDMDQSTNNNQINSNLQSLDFLDQMIQQQNSAFTGSAPIQSKSQNDQNTKDKKHNDIGPSSGDIFAQSDSYNQAQANDQQVDGGRAGRGAAKKVEKEEISSVGISKFQNESEERPDYDRLESVQDQQQQPVNAQAHNSQSNNPNTSQSQIYQGQQEATSNQQTVSSLFDNAQPASSNHEQKLPTSNQGGQSSQFDQQTDQQVVPQIKDLTSAVKKQRKKQNQQDNQQIFEESKGHQSSQQQYSNQQQEQFGNQKDNEDAPDNDARGGNHDSQGLFLHPGETGSQQQQNQQNSNQQQAIDNTTNQQNSQPPCSMDDIASEPAAVQQYQMRFNTIQDDLIDDGAVINKLNLSMHSKPSGNTSGRITPPSNYSSSRRLAGVAEGLNSGSRKGGYANGRNENEGTGSVQMSNDQSAGDTFMQNMQYMTSHIQKVNEQHVYSSTQRNSNVGTMSGGQLTPLAASSHVGNDNNNPYGSFAMPTGDGDRQQRQSFNLKKQPSEIMIEDYQSEKNVGKMSQKSSAKVKKSSKASSKNKAGIFFNQTHGFIPHQSQMTSDHIGTVSVASIPVTTFEDTQKMLQAYKKKKREIMKMKDQYFKLEQEFMSVKQKNLLVEEELTTTQKRLQRVEKQLKQKELNEHINDDSITQRQLQLKNQEQELIQSQLKHQKAENTKLREKVKELLKKCSLAAQQSQSTSLDSQMAYGNTSQSQQPGTSSGPSDADLKVIEQQHQLELVRQREQKNLEIARLQDELQFQKKEQDRLKERIKEVREEAMREAKKECEAERLQLQTQIEEIKQKSQEEIDELRTQNEMLNAQLNEQKFKRSTRPQSGNNESDSRHKAELANYEKIVKDLNQKLKDAAELHEKEKEMILADIARKESIYTQLDQEKKLMQIQIDQLEQSNNQYQILNQQVEERADRLEQAAKFEKHQHEEGVDNLNQPSALQPPPPEVTALSQSQADWQVINPSQAQEESTNPIQQMYENQPSDGNAIISAQNMDTSNELPKVVEVSQISHLQPPMQTAQCLFGSFNSAQNNQNKNSSVIIQPQNTAQMLFASEQPNDEKINESQNIEMADGNQNLLIQSQYFSETSNKQSQNAAATTNPLMNNPMDADASASFFDNLASQQQPPHPPQSSQEQFNKMAPPVYNFDDDSNNQKVELPQQPQIVPPQQQFSQNQPATAATIPAQPQPPAPSQVVHDDSDPYGFMLDDDNDGGANGGSGASQPNQNSNQATGSSAVIPTSMFD